MSTHGMIVGVGQSADLFVSRSVSRVHQFSGSFLSVILLVSRSGCYLICWLASWPVGQSDGRSGKRFASRSVGQSIGFVSLPISPSQSVIRSLC